MNNFNGIFIGTVVDNNDPKKLGRLKLSVPNVYGNIKKEDLPWADPCLSYAYNKQSFFFIPEIDSFVVVMFLCNSPYKPVWLGAIHKEDENIVPTQITSDEYTYPQRKLIKTKTGYIMFDDDNNIIEIKHKNGSVITFKEDGDIVIHSAKNLMLLSDGIIHENPKDREKVKILTD